jgi:hypothetical protein
MACSRQKRDEKKAARHSDKKETEASGLYAMQMAGATGR